MNRSKGSFSGTHYLVLANNCSLADPGGGSGALFTLWWIQGDNQGEIGLICSVVDQRGASVACIILFCLILFSGGSRGRARGYFYTLVDPGGDQGDNRTFMLCGGSQGSFSGMNNLVLVNFILWRIQGEGQWLFLLSGGSRGGSGGNRAYLLCGG